MTAGPGHAAGGGPDLRVALVGRGRWGANVARDLERCPGAALTHIVDVDPEARRRAGSAHPGAIVIADAEAALGDVDAVAVCTPAESHVGIAAAALAASKHVFVEKPVATDSRSADRLAAAARGAGRVLAVGHQMLFHPAFEALVRIVRSGDLGALVGVSAERSGALDASGERDVLRAYGPHDVAMAIRLVGFGPTRVGAGRPGGGPGSAVTLRLDFGDGRRPGRAIRCAITLRGDGPRVRRFTAACERGEAIFEDAGAGACTVRRGGGDAVEIGTPAGEPQLPLERELRAFVAACRGGAPDSRNDGESAAAVTRVLELAARSTGAPA